MVRRVSPASAVLLSCMEKLCLKTHPPVCFVAILIVRCQPIHVVCSPCCQVVRCYLAGTKCNSTGRLLSCGMWIVAEMVSHNVYSYVLNSPSYFHA